MSNVYYSDIKTSFSRICPDMSPDPERKSTLDKQRLILYPPGLTIVAQIEAKKEKSLFTHAIERIKSSERKFHLSTKVLHCTLLGLFGEKRVRAGDVDAIIQSVKEFITRKSIGQLNIHFSLVRLGAFYINGRPDGYCSDGTVIALANRGSYDAKRFNILGDDLASHLRSKYPSIFNPDNKPRLQREHPTVWCTLGYFGEPSFDIDKELCPILEGLKLFSANVTVSKLQVISYEKRSLEDSKVLDEIFL
jgi:hypothetical protein